MRKRKIQAILFAVIPQLVVGTVFGQFAAGQPTGKPKAKLNLVSSVEAVNPGKPFDLGIRFRIEPGWHIYWHNSGESGLPPRVTWELPHGFSAGDLQFPVPKRRLDPSGTVITNILEGEPVLLAAVATPDAVDGQRITLSAQVTYLICKTKCLRKSADLKLELPVQTPDIEVKAAHVGLFERARRALPQATSRFVSITPAVTAKKLTEGETFDLVLTVDVAEGQFLQSHEPLNKGFYGFDVFVRQTPGIYFERPAFPKPGIRTRGSLGRVSEFSGRITVRVPAEVEEDISAEDLALGGIVTYQPCDDQGNCLPAEAVQFSLAQAGKGVAAIAASDIDGTAEEAESTGLLERLGLVGLLIGCFLYGLFINATPCVLPILSIKVLSFVQQAHESRRRTAMLGLAFGAGVTLFFIVLGFLAGAGKNVLQFPAAVIALGTVVMALALSMLGVYTLQGPTAASQLEATIKREGMLASFAKGALAPVLGFACTGPLLAGAFGWATQQPPFIAVFAFLFAGFGMASPYMLLGANPNWLSFLPRPGHWMITFERIMGFLLLGMVLWLLSPLVPQIGAAGLQWTLAFLVAVAMACWLLGKVEITMPVPLRWRYRGAAGAIVLATGLLVYGWIYPLDEAMARQNELRVASNSILDGWSTGIPWRRWSPAAVEREVRAGKIVFVDFTAAWCTMCKTNKALATNTPEARAKMEALGVIPFRADLTTEDAQISAVMHKYNRPNPPLNLIYPPGRPDNPTVLRSALTLGYLLEKLDEAAPSRTVSAAQSDSD